MTELTPDLSLAQAYFWIDSYAFDLGGDNVEQLLEHWLDIYDASRIRLATIEAVFLGQHETSFIEHILNRWLRMGTPNPLFPYEYEQFICCKLPKHLSDLLDINHSKTEETIRDEKLTTEDNRIHQFIPLFVVSSFFNKLKTFGEEKLES